MWCSLDAYKLFRYNRLLRPSGGMADAAVSKTVVERRASSTLASGTIPNKKSADRIPGQPIFLFPIYAYARKGS